VAEHRTPSGRWVPSTTLGTEILAFVPDPLPPTPGLVLTYAELDLLERANRALGRLDGLAAILPDTQLFVYMYVRREAVLSSQIEGTQSSLSDLLEHEAGAGTPMPHGDVEEVSTYVAALTHGLRRLRDDGFPLSLRLIREVHRELMTGARGQDKTPGEFRTTQNWIGGGTPGAATFVPPPREELDACLSALEKFLHDESTPLLLRVAMAHAQFETIHPFLDGNGRVGRLLITLLLCNGGALGEPLLYLSLYFKENRQSYYDALQRVRTEGAWLPWIRFFLRGIQSTATAAVSTAQRLMAVFAEHRSKIQGELGAKVGNALLLHDALKRHMVMKASTAVSLCALSLPTINALLGSLRELGIIEEITGKQRDRVYVYRRAIDVLESVGVDPA
jgi:Fic family protein